jgi:hypothetical protein
LLRFSHIGYNRIPSGPSCTLRPYRYSHINPAHLTRQLTRAFLISQQPVTYRTYGGTCCSGVSTPKTWSLADLSTTCHDEINHLHPSNHCSNHSIDPHHGHLTSQEIEDQTLSQRHKPNSASYKMEDLYDSQTNDCRAKQFYNHKPNPIGIQGIGNQINESNCITRGRKHIGSTWSRNTCLALPLAAAQSLVLEGLEDF